MYQKVYKTNNNNTNVNNEQYHTIAYPNLHVVLCPIHKIKLLLCPKIKLLLCPKMTFPS